MSAPAPSSGYRQVEHTADLALELWGATEVEMLLAGARAVVALLTEEASIDATHERRVELETVDAEDRLVRWLSEILYLASVEGFLLADADVHLEGTGLVATLRGEDEGRDKVRTEIKAVTYHDLALQRSDTEVRATVVMDV